jgi:transposase
LNLSDPNTEKEKDKNYGYFFLENIYNELEISEFLKSFPFEKNHRYNIDEVMKLLVFGRILKPESKKKTFKGRDEYFITFKCALNSIYRSLTQMDEIKEDLQVHLNRKVSEIYGRDASLVFYDVTNYYFETDIEDDFKKKGVSKDKKRTPLVQMGLLIDNKGLPIAYQLFPGNTNDISTLIPFLADVRDKYKLGRIILTADKGLNSGKNLTHLLSKGDGYIVSQKVRGGSKKFIEEVLDEKGYVSNPSNTFKIKSFIRERRVKNEHGEYETIKEKCVCFWSKNYNDREKKKREKLEERLKDYLDNPSKYKASNRHGLKKYIKPVDVDRETGEIKDIDPVLTFDKEKYERDAALDGYYVLVSSELDMINAEIIEKYRGLWKIEDSFRVIKSDLEGRPVYVTRKDHVEAHFLICFIALLISRILEMKLDYKYSIKSIRDSLKNATCRKVERSIYSLNKQDEVFRAIEKVFNVSLNFKHVRIEQLREYKREIIHNTIN